MIQASELRIGNHINTPDGIGVVDGLATYYKKPIISVAGNSYIQHSVSGIPLTEELLLKMGFVRLNFGWIIDNGSRNEHGDIIHGDETFGLFDHSFGKLTNLKYNQYPVAYVHQLMNLYHALTGQELTLS